MILEPKQQDSAVVMKARRYEQPSASDTETKTRRIVFVSLTSFVREVFLPSSKASTYLSAYVGFLHTLWLFTKDDFDTFVLPNTIFGVSAALSKQLLPDRSDHSQVYIILRRLPFVLFFNWSNLLIFDLANQRLPDSIKEDMINKPWRPIPTGRISPQRTRHLMLIAMPVVILSNSALSVWQETSLLFSLTWIYNDLGGGDDNWLVRNTIIAFAFFFYNLGSLKVASGASSQVEHLMGSAAFGWTAIISAVILTTMHVQDLKDQEGDRTHNRQTAPLVLGDSLARWTIAVPILFWSLVCALFWGLWMLPIGVGFYVAYRVLWERGKEADRRSWKLWCLWTAVLYLLPLASGVSTPATSLPSHL